MKREFQIVLTVSEEEFFLLNEHPHCDWIEIRLDLFTKEGLSEKLTTQINRLNAKCIFTFRQAGDTDQKNKSNPSEIDFQEISNQLQVQDHYLDLELNRPNELFEAYANKGFGLIRSVHKFDGILTEKEIRDWIENDSYRNQTQKVESHLPLIYKFAVFPTSVKELAEFLSSFRNVSNEYKRNNVHLTGICMGTIGMLSRIYPESFGSAFTYCCLEEPKAPGQVDLKSLFQLRNEK
ncbi:type I 3-dehydroquinate dehydratase [Leptospira stimsonii]|uniref:3-dehydroquinate dehydratase n=1 Tax=Leptospira stimsonii TaxID=2202203 RepID=A0A396ZC84_9LEPT|nr:type I 3-dehydroquinate dehydratase [Leptospira stimsonii]RHX92145.1 type I 3-dehydroquinate dehydratase [Leptospira stimsonii]